MRDADVKALHAELKRVLRDSIEEVLEGAEADLAKYGDTLFKLVRRAATTRDPDTLAHAKAQVSLLAEMLRIRANDAALRALETVVETVVRVLIGVGRLVR